MGMQTELASETEPGSPGKGVFELLRDRHPSPAWAYMEEVRNATGFQRVTRTADALAMSLYPSRGLHLHGFEVKVSRGDWQKELNSPEKAEEIARFCHYWWLVVSDQKIVKDGELPQPWGLLAVRNGRLVQVKAATFNETAEPPTYGFIGAVFRKFCATETAAAKADEAYRKGHDKGWTDGVAHGTKYADGARIREDFEALQAAVKKFEDRSGISINRWTGGNVADAVKILTTGYDNPIGKMKRFAEEAEEIAKAARAAHDAALEGIKPTDAERDE